MLADLSLASAWRNAGSPLLETLRLFVTEESGASAAEYALILMLIAGAIVGALANVIQAIANGILTPVGAMSNATTSS